MTPPYQHPVSRWRLAVAAGLFVLLSAPLLAWLLQIKPPAEFQEMRVPAKWPDWKSTPKIRWTAAFETWLNDHFPLRVRLIQWHSVVRRRWLGSPSDTVVVGKDDWLFYAGNRTVEDLVGRDRLSDSELHLWRDVLEGRRAWLGARGISYLFVITPNKSTIYPERLPPLLRARMRPGKLDQLLGYLRANSTVPVLDLRPALFAAKAQHTVYWPTDSHWNGYGLTAACDAILAELQALGYAQPAHDEPAWLGYGQVERNGDCADLIAMRGWWPQPPVPVLNLKFPPDLLKKVSPLVALAPWKDEAYWQQPTATERESGRRRVLLLCDSFFRVGGQTEWLAQSSLNLSFRRFVTMWEWTTFEMLATAVDKEHPDIVIEQTTERFLKNIPVDHPEFARARKGGN